jgi:uncharacterized surface anchored protein
VRPRLLTIALTLLVTALCFASISSSTAARAAQVTPPPTTTTPPVEVEGKVIERAPEKSPVPLEEMARTGGSHAETLLIVGLALLAMGVVLIDWVSTSPAPARRPLPRRR